MNATLIAPPQSVSSKPQPLSKEDSKILNEFYSRYGVVNKDPIDKINALKKENQARSFYAFGGGETVEMELRANERIFLLQHGKNI